MADDTQTTPEPSGQPTEPTPEPTPAEPVEPTPEPEPAPEPPQPTPAELAAQAEERAFQRMASWQGRREQVLLDSIGNMIRSIQPQQQVQQPANDPQIDAAKFLENPGQALSQMLRTEVPKIFQETVSTQSRAQQAHTNDVIKNAADIMQSDPLFAGKENTEFGTSVAKYVVENLHTMDRSIPPKLAAKLLVQDAVLADNRQKAIKGNPLAGNKPVTGPMGTISAPAKQPAKSNPVKLDSATKQMARVLRISEAEAAKMLADEK